MQQQPLEQRTGALEDKVRDHDQLLDVLITIAQENRTTLAQLTGMQEQLQGIIVRQQAFLERLDERETQLEERHAQLEERHAQLEERHNETSREIARLMRLLLDLAQRQNWLDDAEDEEEP